MCVLTSDPSIMFQDDIAALDVVACGNEFNRRKYHYLKTILCKQTFDNLSKNERLLWCSTWISLLKTKSWDLILDDVGSTEMQAVIDITISTLASATDQYLLYVTQKLFVMIMKLRLNQTGLAYISDCLVKLPTNDESLRVLEVCCQLLSKRNSHCHNVLSAIQLSLKQHCLNWLPVIMSKESTYTIVNRDQYLFLISSIFIKVAKLLKLNDANAACLIVWLIERFGKLLIDVLINDASLFYSKRQLIKCICYVIKLYSLEQSNDIKLAVSELSTMIIKRLDMSSLTTVMLKHEETCFIGTVDAGLRMVPDVPDLIQLREWLYMFLLVLSVHSKSSIVTDNDQDAKTPYLIHHINRHVSEAMQMKQTVMFPWLSDVFGDQDDVWIDVLLLLFEVDSGRSKPLLNLPHHLYFLQFVSSIGYDHLVLVDLLTSPETLFLNYLTKYLRHAINTWSELVRTSTEFKDSNDILKTSDKRMMVHSYAGQSASAAADNAAADDGDDDVCAQVLKNDIAGHNLRQNEPITMDSSTAPDSLSLLMRAYGGSESDTDEDVTYVDMTIDKAHEPEEGPETMEVNEPFEVEGSGIDIQHTQNKEQGCCINLDTDKNQGCKLEAETDDVCVKTGTDDLTTCISTECEEDCVLDRVMGMLIRVRLQLERLSRHQLLQYNPEILVTLVECVEEKYEDV